MWHKLKQPEAAPTGKTLGNIVMNDFTIDTEHELIYSDNKWIIHKNGIPLTQKPRNLYKYYALTEFNVDAISKGYFYLNNPINFNDPFDCCSNLVIEKQRSLENGLPAPLINDIEDIGVSCFSSNGLNPLMWGHYTKSYCGFVIKFKEDLKLVGNENTYPKFLQVIYSGNPNAISESHPYSNTYQLTTKLKYWEYENEWRLLVHKNSKDFNKVYFPIDAVEEIYLGYKVFPPIRKSDDVKLLNLLMATIKTNYKKVDLYHVGPHMKELKLHKVKFLYDPIID